MPDPRATFEAYGSVLPVPVGPLQVEEPAAEPPVTPVTPVQAAAAVMAAEMDASEVTTARRLAEVEAHAGILFDAAHVQAAADAAREQGRAEGNAELAEVREELAEARKQLALIGGAHRKVQAVLRLCEGRRGDDLLLVSAVAVAAEAGTTALDGLPMTLTWDGSVGLPDGGFPGRAFVHCTTSYGGRADLALTSVNRQDLAHFLDPQADDVHAPCPHSQTCGRTDDELEASYPKLFGWVRLFVVGLDEPGRWYCSPQCVSAATVRAGDKLAAADQAAAADPDEQGYTPIAEDTAEDVIDGEDRIDDDEVHCHRCSCSARRPCLGGCHWVPNLQMIDLCSACATPEELAYAAGGAR